jgi:hypothetical protein
MKLLKARILVLRWEEKFGQYGGAGLGSAVCVGAAWQAGLISLSFVILDTRISAAAQLD